MAWVVHCQVICNRKLKIIRCISAVFPGVEGSVDLPAWTPADQAQHRCYEPLAHQKGNLGKQGRTGQTQPVHRCVNQVVTVPQGPLRIPQMASHRPRCLAKVRSSRFFTDLCGQSLICSPRSPGQDQAREQEWNWGEGPGPPQPDRWQAGWDDSPGSSFCTLPSFKS